MTRPLGQRTPPEHEPGHDGHDGDDGGEGAVTVSTVAILVSSVVLATAGQLLLKAGMNRMAPGVSPSDLVPLVRHALTSWQVMLGLVSFSLSGVFWLVTLTRLPLSTAYPVVSLSYVLILFFSTVVLGERPTPLVWGGALLIMTGIAFVGIGQR